jgi:hypothetical protein
LISSFTLLLHDQTFEHQANITATKQQQQSNKAATKQQRRKLKPNNNNCNKQLNKERHNRFIHHGTN